MNRQKSVRIVDLKYQKSSEKLSLHCGMANLKYSYVLWALFGVLLVALWIGLYVGYVLPVQNSFLYKETQCTITRGILLPQESVQHCPCVSSPCPDPPKTYSCVQIFVNYSIPQRGVKQSLLHYSEAVVENNVSSITLLSILNLPNNPIGSNNNIIAVQYMQTGNAFNSVLSMAL